LSEDQSLFVGFKLDGSLRRQLESLEGPDRKYVSGEDATFLSLCARGGDVYVGKVVGDGLTTDRVDDVRRNVLSIMRRLCPDTRLPEKMEILVCLPAGVDESAEAPIEEKPSFEGF
jgi:hypothetical protein